MENLLAKLKHAVSDVCVTFLHHLFTSQSFLITYLIKVQMVSKYRYLIMEIIRWRTVCLSVGREKYCGEKLLMTWSSFKYEVLSIFCPVIMLKR